MIEPSKATLDEHQLTIQQVCLRYDTDVEETEPGKSLGLNQEQVARMRSEFGENILRPPKQTHPFLKFLKCLVAVFNLLLLFSGALTLTLYSTDPTINISDLYLGVCLVVVAVINALIEFIQQQQSASQLDSFMKMVPQLCNAVRMGSVTQVPASDLVVGDVVFVRMGDKVPADLRLFHTTLLKVDNSSLTGETDPQERLPTNEHSNPLEATNIAFNGTLVVAGEGYGVVIRTGDQTVLGQIASMTSGEGKIKSPLSQEIHQFVGMIAGLAMVTAAVFFVVSLLHYKDIHISLNFAIGTFVAFIPEGLPATVTMLLSVAASRMAGQQVLVKDLQGVETLGAITLLATDKTGTLTCNEMTVAKVWTSMVLHGPLEKEKVPAIMDVLRIAILNSQVKYDRIDIPFERRRLIGDATELGLARFGHRHHPEFSSLDITFPRVFGIPFNSDTKVAVTVHHDGNNLLLFVKGAPERILVKCDQILIDGHPTALLPHHIDAFHETYKTMASQGHRIIAFAQVKLDSNQFPIGYDFRDGSDIPTTGMVFVGMTSLEDPPKHGVREAIGKCRLAGIQVMMVTGDHPLTAEAIARKINLMTSETKQMVAKRTAREIDLVDEEEYDAVVIHGEQISEMDDEAWDHVFTKKEIIFARTSPSQKLEIVKRAQALGHIVGVTGDGVNDAPALKRADLGIAMNVSGSDVSKEAAAMILLDDNFVSTVRGIEEGRLIFSNLKKSIRYTLTHAMPEILPQLLFILVPIPLPLPSILILLIDLGFELLAALSYAWDPPETSTGLMKLPPRKPVNHNSIARLRRMEDRELQPRFDFEARTLIPPSRIDRFFHAIRLRFSPAYWRDRFDPNSDVMVDSQVLSWAYLEAGLIETAVCLITFFVVLRAHGVTIHDSHIMQVRGLFKSGSDPHHASTGTRLDDQQQIEALAQAQSGYFIALIIMQCFNLFACKSKLCIPWGRHMFLNWRNFAGIGLGLLLSLLIIYIRPFADIFMTSPSLNPAVALTIPLAGGFFLLIYATLRHLVLKHAKPTSYSPNIAGLKMHPTVFSRPNRTF